MLFFNQRERGSKSVKDQFLGVDSFPQKILFLYLNVFCRLCLVRLMESIFPPAWVYIPPLFGSIFPPPRVYISPCLGLYFPLLGSIFPPAWVYIFPLAWVYISSS